MKKKQIKEKNIRKICQYCRLAFLTYKPKQRFCSISCGLKNSHSKNRTRAFQLGDRIRLGKKMTKEFKEKRRLGGNPNWKGEKKSVSCPHAIRNALPQKHGRYDFRRSQEAAELRIAPGAKQDQRRSQPPI